MPSDREVREGESASEYYSRRYDEMINERRRIGYYVTPNSDVVFQGVPPLQPINIEMSPPPRADVMPSSEELPEREIRWHSLGESPLEQMRQDARNSVEREVARVHAERTERDINETMNAYDRAIRGHSLLSFERPRAGARVREGEEVSEPEPETSTERTTSTSTTTTSTSEPHFPDQPSRDQTVRINRDSPHRPHFPRPQYRYDRMRDELYASGNLYWRVRVGILDLLRQKGKVRIGDVFDKVAGGENFIKAVFDRLVETNQIIHVETLKPTKVENRVFIING